MSSQKKSPGISAEQLQKQTKDQLFTKIERAVQAKQFQEAESLRERLLEVDPMAISEVIKAAELIEETMTAAIDKEHVGGPAESSYLMLVGILAARSFLFTKIQHVLRFQLKKKPKVKIWEALKTRMVSIRLKGYVMLPRKEEVL